MSSIEGGLLGLLVGDALGVPYEFKPPSSLPPRDQLEMTPPLGFRRSHPSVPPGTWSDDGAQALCLLASLLDEGRLDLADFGRRLVAWRTQGYLAVDGRVFDVGNQTQRALELLSQGRPMPVEERGLGNGALMRVLPLALWHRGDDAALVNDARLSSKVTHPHPRSQVCCALYCLWARAFLEQASDPWGSAVTRILGLIDPAEARDLEEHVRPGEPPVGTGSGYVVDSLASARMVLAAGSYEAVVKAAVALGDDTDTTACIAGGIAGLRDGVEAIPKRWRDALRGRELLDPLLERLLPGGR